MECSRLGLELKLSLNEVCYFICVSVPRYQVKRKLTLRDTGEGAVGLKTLP
jgi:hypothetical protein